MVLVAAAMVAVMAMAALSVDVVTLYLANAETQRSADAAALAAARILSVSGMTGDPTDNTNHWTTACAMATQVAQSVANQNVVRGAVPSTVNVTFPNDPSGTCSDVGVATVFGVNPIVQVQVQRSNLPTFFARIWGHRGANISATAAAEAFNASNSSAYASAVVGVQPRCVKPWIVGNGTGNYFVLPSNGAIVNTGIQAGGVGTGVIGSQVILQPAGACNAATGCMNVGGGTLGLKQYVAASVQGTPVAIASGATGDIWQEAIGGCDQTTVYACGTVGGGTADLTVDLGLGGGDTETATQALTHLPGGEDQIFTTSYPFQIQAGSGNPLVADAIIPPDYAITSSNSIVTIPLADSNTFIPRTAQPPVTIVGFLQVFIQEVGPTAGGAGWLQGVILNVAGCSNTSPPTSVTGSSPVPVRLINYP
jgi:hypothetical protein